MKTLQLTGDTQTICIYNKYRFNLVPRALFPGFGNSEFCDSAPKAREKRPGDEVGTAYKKNI